LYCVNGKGIKGTTIKDNKVFYCSHGNRICLEVALIATLSNYWLLARPLKQRAFERNDDGSFKKK
jgi:hypothetical protein